jgi:hypothetical protein
MKPAPGKEKRYWALLRVKDLEQFKEQKYWAFLTGEGAEQFVEVPKGYKVVIEGFEELELFAYKAWLDGTSDKGKWYVVEATSGFSISAPMRTKARAVQSAKEVLLYHGATETKSRLKSRIEKYGLSPRYQAGG